jgi:hypothetical protein
MKSELVLINEGERKKLKSARAKAVIFSLLFFIAGVSVVTSVMARNGSMDGPFKVFASIFFLFFIGVFVFILYGNLKKFNTDLRLGQKLVVRGEVLRKTKIITSTRSGKSGNVRYQWKLNIGGEEVEVNSSLYKLASAGSVVVLEIAPESKVVFNYATTENLVSSPQLTKEESLYEEEKYLIRRIRRKKVFRTFLFALLWIVVSEILLIVILFSLLAVYPKEQAIAPVFALMLFGAPLFWLIVAAVRSSRTWIKFASDISEGYKEVNEIVLEEVIISNAQVMDNNMVITNRTGDFIYLRAGNFKLQVERDEFEKLPDKIIARVSRTKQSGSVLGMELKR